MKMIPSKNIKYIKLFLISPITEIVINLIYLVTILILCYYYNILGKNYNNNHVRERVQTLLNKSEFDSIETHIGLRQYINTITNKIYKFDPQKDTLTLFVPLGNIRLTNYGHPKEDCSDKNDYTIDCQQDFQCIIESLSKFHQTICPSKYINDKKRDDGGAFKFLVSKFKGYYSSYDLINGGEIFDFNIDNYQDNKIDELLDDNNTKFLSLQFNFIIPSNNVNVDVLIGIEMTNFFKDIKKVFSITIYNNTSPKEGIIFVPFIICFVVVVIDIIKLIYEINVKLIWSVHIFAFLDEILNLVLMIFHFMYLSEAKSMNYDLTDYTFRIHLPFVSIRKYLKLIGNCVLICFPFRLISLLSWWKQLADPFIKSLGVIFRIFPGILITAFLILLFMLNSCFMNYMFYQDSIENYKSIYNSFLTLFTISIKDLASGDENVNYRLRNSMYVIIFQFFQLIFFYLILALSIATLTYNFKLADALESPKTEDEVMLKLEEIEEKLSKEDKEKEEENIQTNKQILWLKLGIKHCDTTDLANKNDILIFKNCSQIISFLKYLFAIKPELRFKKLLDKFAIIVEVRDSNHNIKEESKIEIEKLVDWLHIVGCKIPLAIFTDDYIDQTFLMQLTGMYRLVKFTPSLDEIEKFLKEKENKNSTYCDLFKIEMNTFEYVGNDVKRRKGKDRNSSKGKKKRNVQRFYSVNPNINENNNNNKNNNNINTINTSSRNNNNNNDVRLNNIKTMGTPEKSINSIFK